MATSKIFSKPLSWRLRLPSYVMLHYTLLLLMSAKWDGIDSKRKLVTN